MCFAGSGPDQERPGSSEENDSSGCQSDQVSVKLCLPDVQNTLAKCPLYFVTLTLVCVFFVCVCVRMNREAKQTLELDWSDKYQAYNSDDHSGRYSNMSPDTQHHPSSATMQDQ